MQVNREHIRSRLWDAKFQGSNQLDKFKDTGIDGHLMVMTQCEDHRILSSTRFDLNPLRQFEQI